MQIKQMYINKMKEGSCSRITKICNEIVDIVILRMLLNVSILQSSSLTHSSFFSFFIGFGLGKSLKSKHNSIEY